MTVTGVDDNIIDGSHFSHPLSVVDAVTDDNFDAVANQTVSQLQATTTQGFTVESGGSTSVSETGTTDTFTVVLNAQPDSTLYLLSLQMTPEKQQLQML